MESALKTRISLVPRWGWALAAAALALVVRAPLLSGPYDITLNPDGPSYLAIANGLLHGDPAFGEYRMPGYPTLVAVAGLLPGSATHNVLLVQHLVGGAFVALIVLVGGRLVGTWPAVAVAALVAIHPLMITAEHDVLPDFAYAVALFAAAAFLAVACARDPLDWRYLAAAGVAFGLTAYVKPTSQVAVLVGVLPLAVATRSVRKTVWGAAIVAAAVLMTMAPWVIRNIGAHGDAVMTIQGGEALFYRVFDQDRLPVPIDQPYGKIAADAHAKAVGTAPKGTFTDSYSAVSAALDGAGLAEDRVRSVEKDLAVTAIGRDPAEYLQGTFSNIARQAGQVNDYGNSLASAQRKLDDAASGLPHALATVPWSVARQASKAWLLLTLGGLTALAAIFLGPRERRIHAAAFTSTWILIATATALTSAPLERYGAQSAVLLWLPAAAGTATLVDIVFRRVRARRAIRWTR